MLKVAILADDLTGASDTGVQMTGQGLKASVLLDYRKLPETSSDVVVIDTDSRSVTGEEAYHRVAKVCDFILQQRKFDIIYKKVDSTMRGNVGAEMDAVYHHVRPDFIVMAPSFPEAGRVVRDGHMYVYGVPLHETDAARDPKNPVTRSYLPDLLGEQTKHPMAVVKAEELRGDAGSLAEKMRRYREQQIPYLLFDAETNDDLRRIVDLVQQSGYRVVWSGSAALAKALSGQWFRSEREVVPIPFDSGTVCMVVGSVSTRSRRQLEAVLRLPGVTGVEMRPEYVLEENSKRQELERLGRLAEAAMRSSPKALVLYSSGNADDVEKARRAGAGRGMGAEEVSNAICQALGELAAGLISGFGIRNLVLTGGDTARQVCLRLGTWEIELVGELEVGVPIGRLSGDENRWVITKAGGFGSEQVLCDALKFFRKEGIS